MPAKRSPKKSRKPSVEPSLVDLTPPDLDTIAVAPAAPVALPVESPAPPKAGPPPGRDARFAGRAQQKGQARRYAFRRS
ncbi:hypothetical protein MRQ36_06015 [Micromonospora sp. R77]|uniref:hypothetical protein n=1 Tax=Micromonospora sp. R77 TaxID=2925836 RepID=UPI001F60A317|nr:hypothetical protein [Micromonospora sp. R77]MCI4062144.1 hypothetical protein [Micromonospora sp. R77]